MDDASIFALAKVRADAPRTMYSRSAFCMSAADEGITAVCEACLEYRKDHVNHAGQSPKHVVQSTQHLLQAITHTPTHTVLYSNQPVQQRPSAVAKIQETSDRRSSARIPLGEFIRRISKPITAAGEGLATAIPKRLLNNNKSDSDFLQSYLSEWSTKFGEVPDTLPTKQPFWDRPGLLEKKALVEASLASTYHRTCFLAASSQHSGDWLFTLPIASCGLKLDDEAVRVAVK